MSRKQPKNSGQLKYIITLVGTQGRLEDLIGEISYRLRDDRTTLNLGGVYSDYLIAYLAKTGNEGIEGIEFDVYVPLKSRTNTTTDEFRKSLGILTTPMLQTGYTIFIKYLPEVAENPQKKIEF